MLFFNPILIIAATLPALYLMYRIYHLDHIEKEPPHLLFALFRLGLLATVIAMVLEWVGTRILQAYVEEGTMLYNAIMYFIIVAISEEGAKYFLLKRRTWNDPNFNYTFDGVVYAVFVSLGFALAENIMYVMLYGFRVALLRAVTAIPGHACFGIFMGTWYGMAKRYEQEGNRLASRACSVLAFLIPALLHGTYNFIASINNDSYGWIFVAFILIMFFVAIRLVKHMSRTDQPIY